MQDDHVEADAIGQLNSSEAELDLLWRPQDGFVPPLQEDSIEVASGTVQASAQMFCMQYLSTASGFLLREYERQGFTDAVMTDWEDNAVLGAVRTLTFVKHMPKAGMGPSKTRCVQNHGITQVQDGKAVHVIFTTEQQMLDIPFSNSFLVCLRWVVTQTGDAECHVAVTLRIPFSKSCFVKGMIIRKTIDETLPSVQTILDNISKDAAERNK